MNGDKEFFRVGQTIYFVHTTELEQGGYADIEESKVQKVDRNWCRLFFESIGEEWFSTIEVGDCIFLTREEAEKRLKELQNG